MRSNIFSKNPDLNYIGKCSALLIVLFFGINFSIEYATDTYATFMDNTVWEYMLYENGRVINAFIYWIFYRLSFSPRTAYLFSYLCAMTFAFLSVFLYSLLLNTYSVNKYYVTFLSFFVLMNPFCIEYFLYIEKGLFLFSLFCVIAAVCCINYYFEYKKLSMLFFAFLFLVASVFCYQIIIAMFVICSLPLIVKRNHSLKDFIYKNVIIALLYGSSLGCSFILTSFCLHSSRIAEQSESFSYTLKNTITNIIAITKDSYYYLPNNFLLICYFVCFLAILFLFIQNTRKFLFMLTILYGFGTTILVSFFPFICGVTSDFACRTIYPYGAIWGILVILSLLLDSCFGTKETSSSTLHFNCSQDRTLTLKAHAFRVITILFFLIILTQYILFQQVFLNRYKGNQTDKYICQMIGERIHMYETNTGNTITTICFYKDQSLTWGIDGVSSNGLLDRAHSTGWSNLSSINYFLNKEYVKGTPSEYYTNLFQQKNWDFFSDDQLYFEGTTLHYCVY